MHLARSPLESNTMQTQTKRLAYTPAEFAASCGRHPTWAYRLLYANKVRAITELGRLLIPAAEVSRVLDLAEPYNPKRKPKAQDAEAEQAL